MSRERPDKTQMPEHLPVLALLGLSTPGEHDWTRVRGLQFAGLRRASAVRALAHAAGALVVISVYLQAIAPMFLVLWAAALAACLYLTFRTDGKLNEADRQRVSRRDAINSYAFAGLLGVVWAVPALAFAPFAPVATALVGWTVIATLIAGAVTIRGSTPLGTLLFAGIAGLAQIAKFILLGQWLAAVAVGVFLALMVRGIVENARVYLKAQIAEAGVAEKTEVVSLLLREFEEGEADWLWQIDPGRRIRSVSPRFAFALGRDKDECDGQSFIEMIAGEAWQTGQFPPSLHELAEKLKSRESFSNLLVQVAIGQERRWWELSGTPIEDTRGRFAGFRGVGSDVTEQRESSEKIAWLARYDTLTGLPNRLMLTEALGEAMKYSEEWRTRCAFLMIDLDRFKQVNDSLGHHTGDKLLARVSDRLQSLMGETAMCGRLGGDEFAVVIRDAEDKDKVVDLARAIIGKLSEPYEVDRHTLYVGASVGYAFGPRDGDSVEMLMRNADLALYRAKDEGGSEMMAYKPELHAHVEERRKLEIALRHSLERGEMSLAFQPVVDARAEGIVSFEALLRWNSAEHGFVSPAKFIPLAEDTRLIVPIGEWVLRQACAEAMNWPDHTRVAVNVSGEQLLDPNFASVVVSALSSTGLPARRLEIEVTESIFLRDDTASTATLERIIDLGCSVALDDFGTGYSSLGYLRRVQFSTIKVDRSFVQGACAGNRESLAIIRAVVAMAQSLEMSTTAEGVETAEEAALIRDLGCTKIQGYYFGRPMPANEAVALFRRNRAAGAAA